MKFSKITLLLFVAFLFISVNTTQAQSPGKFYKIQNVKSSFFLANNGSKKSGDPIYRKAKVNLGGQWMMINMGDKGYMIYNRSTGSFIASYGQKEAGSTVKQTFNPGAGAYWKISKSTGNISIQNIQTKLYIANYNNPNVEMETAKLVPELKGGGYWRLVEVN